MTDLDSGFFGEFDPFLTSLTSNFSSIESLLLFEALDSFPIKNSNLLNLFTPASFGFVSISSFGLEGGGSMIMLKLSNTMVYYSFSQRTQQSLSLVEMKGVFYVLWPV